MGDFVRKQRAIPVDELSKDDNECFCCSTTYGQLQAEGLIEYAVKLECSHILGSICLTKWLQYSNTCPHVSHVSSLGFPPSSQSRLRAERYVSGACTSNFVSWVKLFR